MPILHFSLCLSALKWPAPSRASWQKRYALCRANPRVRFLQRISLVVHLGLDRVNGAQDRLDKIRSDHIHLFLL